jgi:hypothetical protein
MKFSESEYSNMLHNLACRLAPKGMKEISTLVDEYIDKQSLPDEIAAILWVMNHQAMMDSATIAHLDEHVDKALLHLHQGNIDQCREALEAGRSSDSPFSSFGGPFPELVVNNDK